jgi:hypothetical protein
LRFSPERHISFSGWSGGLCGNAAASPRSAEAPEGKFWLQHADGHCDTITDETAAGISAALRGFDWEGEIAKYARLKDKAVPPGLGLGNFGDPHFVHVTSSTGTDCDVLYARGGRKAPQIFKKGLPFDATGKIIAAYVRGDERKLLELLA